MIRTLAVNWAPIPDPFNIFVQSQSVIHLKLNRITCRITERLQLQSWITNESQIQLQDPSYTAAEPRWQSTIDMMEMLLTEQLVFKKGGDTSVYTIKSYQQVESQLKSSLLRYIPRSQQTHPPRSQQTRLPWSRPDGHRRGLRKMITKSRWIKEAMPCTDEYLLQDILYRACGCTA